MFAICIVLSVTAIILSTAALLTIWQYQRHLDAHSQHLSITDSRLDRNHESIIDLYSRVNVLHQVFFTKRGSHERNL